jgi:hypothetical protein
MSESRRSGGWRPEDSSAEAGEGLRVIDNPYYSPKMQGPYELFSLGDFVVEEGDTLRDCKLAYATFGELNEAKDNDVVLRDTPELRGPLHRCRTCAEPGEVLHRGDQPARQRVILLAS